MDTINVSFRVDKQIKNQAVTIIEEYGLKPSQVLRLVFQEIAETGNLPISLKRNKCHRSHTPNAVTEQALLEASRRTDFSDSYETPEAALKAMQEIADA